MQKHRKARGVWLVEARKCKNTLFFGCLTMQNIEPYEEFCWWTRKKLKTSVFWHHHRHHHRKQSKNYERIRRKYMEMGPCSDVGPSRTSSIKMCNVWNHLWLTTFWRSAGCAWRRKWAKKLNPSRKPETKTLLKRPKHSILPTRKLLACIFQRASMAYHPMVWKKQETGSIS